ncbi:MAG: molybdenum ABC transporter substrate-binding protein, partial [Haloplanus sp.]
MKGIGAAGAAGMTGLAGCSGGGGDGTTPTGSGGGGGVSGSMTIFHAGSLAPPFSAAEPKFEEEYGVDVNREPKGSVASTQKITQQGRKASVLGVSDFRLIRDRVLPDYGNWYA